MFAINQIPLITSNSTSISLTNTQIQPPHHSSGSVYRPAWNGCIYQLPPNRRTSSQLNNTKNKTTKLKQIEKVHWVKEPCARAHTIRLERPDAGCIATTPWDSSGAHSSHPIRPASLVHLISAPIHLTTLHILYIPPILSFFLVGHCEGFRSRSYLILY